MTTQQTSLAIRDLGDVSDQLITSDYFGGIYIGYRNFDRYSAADTEIGLTNLRWPGGAASEKVSWYGLEFDNLTDPSSNKPGLSEMAAYTIANDAPLNVIIPTGEYKNDLDRAKTDFEALLSRIASGELGEMPRELTFEIGNEYYAMQEFRDDPGAYGEVVNVYAETMAEFLAENPDAFAGIDVNFTAQIGKNLSDNSAILAEMSGSALSVIDTLVFHRFAWSLDDAVNHVDRVEDALDEWVDAGLTPEYEVYLSGWNVGSWTREEARSRFIDEVADTFGETVQEADINLDTRNDAVFEHFWQTGELTSSTGVVVDTKWGVANRDYGLAQAAAMLEILTGHAEVGVDSASIYGVDTPYAAHLSFGDEVFVGGAMLRMMSEALPGTTVMDTGITNARDGELNLHAFEGEGKVVLYVSADAFDEGISSLDAQLDLSDFGVSFSSVTARSLTSTLDANWKEKYGIVDRADIDESPEARLYERGVITEKEVGVDGDTLTLSFGQGYEVIEITLHTTTTVTGSDGADMLSGTAGDDFIFGLDGDDVIDARDGGADVLTGGAGSDVFVFGVDGHADRVTDFTVGEDKIDLEQLTSAMNMVRVSLGEFEFVRTRRFEDDPGYEAGEIIFEQSGEDVLIRYQGDPRGLAQEVDLDIAVLENVSLSTISLSDIAI